MVSPFRDFVMEKKASSLERFAESKPETRNPQPVARVTMLGMKKCMIKSHQTYGKEI